MTDVTDREPDVQPALRLGEAGHRALPLEPADVAPADVAPTETDRDRPEVPAPLAAASAALAAAGGGWMLGGAFTGLLAHVVAVGAALLGGAFVALSYLTRRPGIVQALALPAAELAGAAVAAPDLSGGSGSLPSQVGDAIREGGLSEPPVAFDPGWRVLLVLLVTLVTVTAAGTAMWTRRPQFAVLIPLPLLVAGVFVQPPGKHLVTVCVALVFVVAALSVGYGAQLAQQGVAGARFELRRLLSAAAIGIVLIAALGGVGQIGALLPAKQQSQTIPPRKPATSPPGDNHVLFTVKGAGDNPLRLGVLDVYEGGFWLTPPYDPDRYVELDADGTVPADARAADGRTAPGGTLTVSIDATDLDGRALPDLAGTSSVTGYGGQVSYDPRTQSLITNGRIPNNATYTVSAPQLPTGDQLSKAPATAVPAALQPFLSAPTPPYAVQNLLLKMPRNMSAYSRLAYLRQQYYTKAVASGPGNPTSVTAQRVADILAGRPASPYEIAAGEVLLARWAGIPARLGYGYFGGEPQPDGSHAMRATDGAMWLEAYFPTYGWVPIVGRPQHARPSLSANPKNTTKIQATDRLGADLYVPVQLASLQLLYTLARYWAIRMLPWAVGVLLVWFGYAGAVKYARRLLRRRWANRHGPLAVVMSEYAELRDYANDLNVGHPTMTPLEFLDAIEPDEAHSELAWLVSRACWGDLVRDLRPEDARHAATMARSVRRRLFAGQPIMMRLLAFGSRVSLRAPYTDAVPNLWLGARWDPAAAPRRIRRPAKRRARVRQLLRPSRPSAAQLRRGALRAVAACAVVALFTVLVVSGGVRTLDLKTTAAENAAAQRALPAVPAELAGVRFERELGAERGFYSYTDNSLIGAGRLYALHLKDDVVGTVQFGVFKPAVRSRGTAIQHAMLDQLGRGVFQVSHLNGEQIYTQRLAEVSLLVWFAPDDSYYELMTAKNGYDTADELLVNLLNFQRTGKTTTIKTFSGKPPIDPRRGAP